MAHHTQIASHRGGAQVWPENSPTAFRNTAGLMVEQVEFDVHPTPDGRLAVIHDATLDRTTDGSGRVADRSWPELQRLVLKGTDGERIPALEDVVRRFRDTPITLRLEIKCDADRQCYAQVAPMVVRVLQAEGVLAKTIVTSFQADNLLAMRAAGAPQSMIWLIANMVLADIGIDGVLAVAREHRFAALSIHHSRLDPPTVARVREAGLGIGGYGAHEDAIIRHMFALGVDVFTTDRPDRAVAIRAELGI
jgi:glycerophosphoryl diester phosphodiesterase